MNALPFAASPLLAAIVAAQNPALTIYNQNFAVVRDRVTLDLAQGVNDVSFAGVTMWLEPDSVVLRDPMARVPLTILEQNYRADTASQPALLRMYEGKELDFLVVDHQKQTERIVRGKVVRAPTSNGYDVGDQPIIQVDGAVRFSLPGQPLFPPLTGDTILAPTLDWRLNAGAAVKLDAEVSYVTGGLRWVASYNLVAPEKGDTVDLVGWITMENNSGKTFHEATIKLMAGDVNKITPSVGPRGPMNSPAGPATASRGFESRPEVTEKAFDEFHLYSLPLPTTLRDRQQKQVEFVRATNVKAPAIYVYNGAPTIPQGWNQLQYRTQCDYGNASNPKVWVMREFANTKANGLGLPLPAGRTRFYRRDDADNRLEFVGENAIDHTPKDEQLRIYTGDSFDLVGERKCTDFKGAAMEVEETFEIRVRNRKDVAAEVRVFERLWRWRNWEVLEKSHEFAKLDAASIEFLVPVPPNGEGVVTYRVRYRW